MFPGMIGKHLEWWLMLLSGRNEVEDNKIFEVFQKVKKSDFMQRVGVIHRLIHPIIDVGMLIIRKLKQLVSRRVPL